MPCSWFKVICIFTVFFLKQWPIFSERFIWKVYVNWYYDFPMYCKFFQRINSIIKPWSYDTNRRFIEIIFSWKTFKTLSSWSYLRLGKWRNFYSAGESGLLVKKKYLVISVRKSFHLLLIFSCYCNTNYLQGNHCFSMILVSYDKKFSEPYVDDILNSTINLM